MNRASTYEVKVRKIVAGGHRNIDAYYIVLKNQRHPVRYISKAMRLDQDNQDVMGGEAEIKPALIELWNYDKMKLVDRFNIDFKLQGKFTWSIYQDNLQVSIERHNLWEEEMKNRKNNDATESDNLKESQTHTQKNQIGSAKTIQYTLRLKNSTSRHRAQGSQVVSPLLPTKKTVDMGANSATKASNEAGAL